jgi:ribosomal protein S18 acetylase RimI-like enzyme
MSHLKEIVQRMDRRWMVLMGGVFIDNQRAVHFYEKHGFRKVGSFENTPGLSSYDMLMEL